MQKNLEQVRVRLERWVKTHASREAERQWKESILSKDGCLHGYRFCIGSVEAVWVIDQLTMEVRRDGRLADTLALADPSSFTDSSNDAVTNPSEANTSRAA